MSMNNIVKKRPKKEDGLFGLAINLLPQAMKCFGEGIAVYGLAKAVEVAILFIGKFFSLFRLQRAGHPRCSLDNLEPDNS